eukprot:5002263-Alexandrium_andersonii.AAC.1
MLEIEDMHEQLGNVAIGTSTIQNPSLQDHQRARPRHLGRREQGVRRHVHGRRGRHWARSQGE